MSIGRNLMILMYDKRVSSEELAKEIDVSPSMISKIINGVKVPSLPKLMKIAEYLGVTLDELVR